MSSRPAMPGGATRRWLLWSALGTIYVVWGSTYLAIRITVETMPPLLAASARFLVAGVALYLVLWLALGRERMAVTRLQLLASAAVGTALLLFGNGLVMVAEQTVASGVAALVIGSVPLWVVVLRVAAGERVSVLALAGVAIGFLGVALLVLPGGVDGSVSLGGALLLVVASASWATGSFFSRRLPLPSELLVSTALQMICGGIALALAGLLTGEAARLDVSQFSAPSIVALLYLTVFGSLLAYTAYTWLLQHAAISLVATYAYVNPVVAVALGTIVLAEPITPTLLVGALLVIGAVAFIVARESASRRPGTPPTGLPIAPVPAPAHERHH